MMRRLIPIATALLLSSTPLWAQTPRASFAVAPSSRPAAADTTGDDADESDDDGEGRPGVQFGVASGALSYFGGRTERGLGCGVWGVGCGVWGVGCGVSV